MSYAAKVISVGVLAKAILMSILVSALAVAGTFADQVVLVLVSATATGIFGLLIVLVQTHAERATHERLDKLEAGQHEAASKASEAAVTAAEVNVKAQTIVDAVTGNGETK